MVLFFTLEAKVRLDVTGIADQVHSKTSVTQRRGLRFLSCQISCR